MNEPNTPVQTPENPAQKTAQTRSKRTLFIVLGGAIVVVALLIGVGIFTIKQLDKPKTVSVTKQLEKAPAMIGSYRIVNACQSVPISSYKQVFGYDITKNDSIDNDYADGSRTKRINAVSSCSTSFGDQTLDIGGGNTAPGNKGSIRITLEQYTDPKLAASSVKPYQDLKGQDVDLSAIGIDDTVTTSTYETIPVNGLDAYLNTTRGDRFYFAYRNVSAGFVVSDFNGPTAEPKVVTNEYVRQLVSKIVPVVKASIDNQQLPQEPLAMQNENDRVLGGSSARAIQLCDYFTSEDFKLVTGTYDDSTQLNTKYDTNPIAEAKRPDADPHNKSGGIGDVSCTRKGYVNAVEPSILTYPDIKAFGPADTEYGKIEYPVINESVNYYKNKEDAIGGAKFKESAHKQNYPDTVNTPVSGLGDYAVFSKFTFTTDLVKTEDNTSPADNMYYLYVVKGPYLITIDMHYSKYGFGDATRMPTDAQYKQAAQLLINRLPN